jgi:acetyl esterase/lipase
MWLFYIFDTVTMVVFALLASIRSKSNLSFFTRFIYEVVSYLLRQAEHRSLAWLRFQDKMLGFVYWRSSKSIGSSQYHLDVRSYTIRPCKKMVSNTLLIYLHGGGFVLHSKHVYQAFCQKLSNETGMELVFLDYNLAPDATYPRIHHDCLAAIASVITQHPGAAVQLVGDSAGANILLYCYQCLDEKNRASVTGLAMISPWLEISSTVGENLHKNSDDYLTTSILAKWQQSYCDEIQSAELDDIIRRFEFTQTPNIFIQYSSTELIAYQAEAFVRRSRLAGRAITISHYPALFHIFQILAMDSPEGRDAIAQLCNFLKSNVAVQNN